MRPFRSLTLVLAMAGVLSACLEGGVDVHTGSPSDPALGGAPPEGVKAGGTWHTGYLLNPDGSARRITYEVRDGLAIIEGDMAVGAADTLPRSAEEALRAGQERQQLGGAVGDAYPTWRWSGGTVPYWFDAHITPAAKQAALQAMEHIEYWTAYVNSESGSSPYRHIGQRIKFVPWSGEKEYVWIGSWDGCYATTSGKDPSQQNYISLGAGCEYKGIAIHELSHSLGLLHEQSRCDRDSYIWVYYGNIQSGWASQFDKYCSGYKVVAEYDEGSIMHYAYNAVSANGSWTMESKRGRTYEMGQRDYLSWNDIYTLQWMYGYNYGKTANQGTYTGPFKLYSGPGTSYSVVGTINAATVVKIACQQAGTSVNGPWGANTKWNKLGGAYAGKWLPDALTYTGSTGYVSARCNLSY